MAASGQSMRLHSSRNDSDDGSTVSFSHSFQFQCSVLDLFPSSQVPRQSDALVQPAVQDDFGFDVFRFGIVGICGVHFAREAAAALEASAACLASRAAAVRTADEAEAS